MRAFLLGVLFFCLIENDVFAKTPECISKGLVLSDLKITNIDEARIYYSAQIANRSPKIIGGFYYKGQIRHINRAVHLADFRLAENHIAGGLEPGEKMNVEDWMYLGERAVAMIENASQIKLIPELYGVSDKNMRPFDIDSFVAGWIAEEAPNPCQ